MAFIIFWTFLSFFFGPLARHGPDLQEWVMLKFEEINTEAGPSSPQQNVQSSQGNHFCFVMSNVNQFPNQFSNTHFECSKIRQMSHGLKHQVGPPNIACRTLVVLQLSWSIPSARRTSVPPVLELGYIVPARLPDLAMGYWYSWHVPSRCSFFFNTMEQSCDDVTFHGPPTCLVDTKN